MRPIVLANLGGLKSCSVLATHLQRSSFPPLSLCTFVAIVLSLHERGSRHSLCLRCRRIHLLRECSFCRYQDLLLRHVRLISTSPSTIHTYQIVECCGDLVARTNSLPQHILLLLRSADFARLPQIIGSEEFQLQARTSLSVL
jgi:hypothetical protein